MRVAQLIAVLLLTVFLVGECRPGNAEQRRAMTLTVFAAASLTDAFSSIEQAYEAQHPDVDVVLNLAGSQHLAQQLRLGAPGDVFASADPVQMDVAVEAGRVAPDAPQPFARNRLVVVTPRGNPAGVERLADLARPGMRIVLADEAVPAGRYARQVLEKATGGSGYSADFQEQALGNVVSFEQNVRAVLTKIELGEADAGVVYATDARRSEQIHRLPIPGSLNVTATYPIAPVRDGPHAEAASSFVRFVLGARGQQILVRHGFVPVATP